MAADAFCVKSLFLAASDLADPADRAAYLDRECGGDAELRHRVEALLRANDAVPLPEPARADVTGPFISDAPAAASIADAPPQDEQAGTEIAGKYTLVERIGEGGMGSVWRAKQTEPVKRAVAVKVIKAGMDSKAVLARFEAERQALAMMDHPSIAKVLDGGLHEHRPFFVMELVKGVPITDYCDKCKLTPKERLDLFVPVCQAIQHAHQKGIIHRDIKPSNVLVALYDDKPVVKVIDFGVAKATGVALTERTLDTGFGGIVGTPQYMSPEQATFNNLDIDTRSDVYSLGVLLYELLTGMPPFGKKDLEKKGLLEMLRVVREEEPPQPSTKLSTAEALPSLSANRGTEPKKLTGLLRNELDWIVMKALEKDRKRRYETANGFAADVQRYLSGEAVQAHPPSTAYQVKKFLTRHKGQATAASLVFGAPVAGIVGTTLGLVEAKQQEAEAKRQECIALALANEERQAKEQSQRNLTFAKKGNAILGSVFAGLDPKQIAESGLLLQDVLRENLVKAVQELEGSAIGDPLEVAAMQNTLGLSLLGLGEYGLAVEVLGKALQTRQAKLGPEYHDTLTSMNNLAYGYQTAGQPAKALPLYEEALRLRKAKRGPDHPYTLTSMNNLAGSYMAAGQLDKALPLYEETLKLAKAKPGPEHPHTLTTMGALALGYQAVGRLDKALPLLEETLRLRRATLGPEHPDTLTSMGALAAAYWQLKRLDQSIPLFEEALALSEKKLGRQHPFTLRAMANLGVNYKDAGRLGEALPLLEEAYAASKKVPQVRWVAAPLLDVSVKARRPAETIRRLVADVLADARRRLPKDSLQLAGTLATVGLSLLQVKAFAEAEPILRECLAVREKKEPDDWTTFNTQSLLGGALLGQKKYAEAEPLLLKGYEGMKAHEKTIPPQGSTRIPEALDRLIELYTVTNKPDEVKKWQAERAKYPATAPQPAEKK